MSPTIRVDEQVYAWLQNNAKPFDDTPNSVLRRIAGLDQPSQGRVMSQESPVIDSSVSDDSSETTPELRDRTIGGGRSGVTGKQLNSKWRVGARHALFSRDGNWYENLKKFPGALFDLHGYILFHTEAEYRNNRYISIGEKTNIRGGISSIPGYVCKE